MHPRPSFAVFTLLSLGATQNLSTVINQYQGFAAVLISATAPWGTDNSTNAVSPVPVARRTDLSACVNQIGNGPHVVPDTDVEFLASPSFSAAATTVAINAPDGFTVASNWINLEGSNSDNTGYLTYVSSQLSSYDADQCATICGGISSCASFVIYFERDPELVSPTTYTPVDPECPGRANSTSVTLIKCAFYSVPLYSGNATNVGQYQGDFHLVVAGSTAFNAGSPAVDGWTGPVNLGDAAIDIPQPVDQNGYIQAETFPNAPFDPNTCAANCASLTEDNQGKGSTVQCTMFNAYVLYENGVNGYV